MSAMPPPEAFYSSSFEGQTHSNAVEMGKKGGWISALKRVFTSSPKDTLAISGPDRDFVKEKKRWAIGKLRNGGTKAFIHLHKEPSSIEKILGDAEREHHRLHHHPQPPQKAQHRSSSNERTVGTAEREPHRLQQHPQTTQKAQHQSSVEATVRSAGRENHRLQHHPEPQKKAQHQSSHETIVGNAGREQTKPPPSPRHRAQQPRTLPSKPTASANSPPTPTVSPSRITINHSQKSAIKIQAAYRGYMARKSYRALRGLVRLQGVMRGQNVKRQRMNALQLMQLFVRVQSQVRTRRIQAMESQNPQRRMPDNCDKGQDSNINRWTLSHKSVAEEQNEEVWDSSLLTKVEMDARAQRKVEAIMKRERALAYVTSHQPKSPYPSPAGLRSVWWGWLDRHFQSHRPPERAATSPAKVVPPPTTAGNGRLLDAPVRPSSRDKRPKLGHDDPDTCTPRSTHATPKARGRPISPPKCRNPPPSRAGPRDDESLTSCPAFTVPGYMAPTQSAKAKLREQAFLREGPPPAAKRRFSFGLSHSIGALRWGKGSSLLSAKEASAERTTRGTHRPMQSMGNLSVDSAASMPAGVGRRPFYR
ncbi:hypothetical protein Taro_055040 [Colocasia esculenta]|uniref:DUF4005 domain-containing protein n=1 Tax=Colocasia esculenta TaxID=4460 RepID=A0A843XS58_COLES|nr:hypothetical protein [Colocasia esculenta]